MTLNVPRISTGLAIAAVLALATACSAPASLSPTGPSAASTTALSSSAVSGTMCDTDCPPPPECQAIRATSAVRSATIDPCEPPPPPTCETDPTLCTGRFTGGGFQFDDRNVRVTRGFTIHCDNRLTNNLEVNWAGGNNFHLDKNSLTSVLCSLEDDPRPPRAPVSQITASGTGSCNGVPGATINFTLIDRGEPGRNDSAELIISGAGSCSLNLTLRNLDGGNIQAHFDQPHK